MTSASAKPNPLPSGHAQWVLVVAFAPKAQAAITPMSAGSSISDHFGHVVDQ